MSKKLLPKLSSLSIILVTTFCILTLPWPISGEIEKMAGAATVNVVPHSQTVTQNTELEISIRVYPEGALAGIQCDFHFDPTLVNIINITKGNLFGTGSYFNFTEIDNVNGTITGIKGTILGGSVSEPGDFAVITLKSLYKEGISPLNLSNVIAGDPSANSLSLTINNGTVDVEIESTEIKIIPSHQTTKQNTFLEVNVSLEPAEEIWGVQFDILFDPDEVTVNNISGGIFGQPLVGEINNTEGFISTIGAFNPGPGGTSSLGNVAIINFSVSSKARGSTIEISNVLLFDAESKQIPSTRYTVENGSFNVEIEETVVEITPSVRGVKQKELFTVDITVTPGTEIAGIQTDIIFDSALITAVNVTKGDLFDSYFDNGTIDNANGKITDIAYVATSPGGVTDPGILATIIFNSLVKEGTAFINFSNVIVGDPYGLPVPSTTHNGSVTIEIDYTDIFIEPAIQTVTQEEIFTVNVNIDPKEEIAGVQFDIVFDPSLVLVENISYGGFFGPEDTTALFLPGNIDNINGIIKDCSGVYLGEGGISSPGTIAVITFTSKIGSGTSLISLSDVQIGDSEAQPVPIEITHGTVGVTLEHTFTLRQGWNLITIPVQHTYTAETLGHAIPLCDTIVMWDVVNQSYLAHPVGTAVHDFVIQDGIGYFVHVTGDTTFSVTGVLIENISIAIQPGWNLIGWANIINATAETIGESIINCDTVLGWDVIAQEYVGHPMGTPIHNFNVAMGQGLFIHANSESIWYGK